MLPENISADAVFHLASPASPNHHSSLSYHALSHGDDDGKYRGNFGLLKFAEKIKAKFLFASTSEVYGDPLEHPSVKRYIGNTSTTGPRSVYDEAKGLVKHCPHIMAAMGVDIRIARIFNTYDPICYPRIRE